MSSDPMLGVVTTLAAYMVGVGVHQASGRKPWASPVMIGIVVLLALLHYEILHFNEYWQGGRLVSFLMGPIIVALALPLFDHIQSIWQHMLPVILSLLVGAVATVASVWVLADVLDLSDTTKVTLTTKSVTTPIGIEIAGAIGGVPALAALTIIMTGVLGAVFGPSLLTVLRIKDPLARAMAYGVCAHAIGTQKAFEESAQTGAVAALAMSLMGMLSAIVIPLMFAV